MMSALWASMLVRFITMLIAWSIVITLFFVILRWFERYAEWEASKTFCDDAVVSDADEDAVVQSLTEGTEHAPHKDTG